MELAIRCAAALYDDDDDNDDVPGFGFDKPRNT